MVRVIELAVAKKNNISVSIIIAVLNEEKNLPILHSRLETALDKQDYSSYELIFVDDGSTDKTKQVLKRICRSDKHARAIVFDRNYGKTRAIEAGANSARCEVLVTIDADLQHDPDEIYKLVNKISDGYDVVTGQRVNRDDALVRMVFSRIVNYMVYLFTGFKAKDFYSGFKAFRRSVVDQLGLFSDLYRFVAYLAFQKGLKTVEVPIRYLPRKHGKSKYGFGLIKRTIHDLLIILFVIKHLEKGRYAIGETISISNNENYRKK